MTFLLRVATSCQFFPNQNSHLVLPKNIFVEHWSSPPVSECDSFPPNTKIRKKKSNKKHKSFKQLPMFPPSLSSPSDGRLSQNVSHLMKGSPEKWLELDKPKAINPEAPSVTFPSADCGITSECISLSSQLVWWPVDLSPSCPWPPQLPCRAWMAENMRIGPFASPGLWSQLLASWWGSSSRFTSRKAEGGIHHFSKAKHYGFKRNKSQLSQALKERLTSAEKENKRPWEASLFPPLWWVPSW